MSDPAERYLAALVAALEDRGLRVAAKLPALTVKHPASARHDRQGQQVLIRDIDGRGLAWFWVWPGLRSGERGEPDPEPEVEEMCPARDVERAADLIKKVVVLHRPELAVTGDSGPDAAKDTDRTAGRGDI